MESERLNQHLCIPTKGKSTTPANNGAVASVASKRAKARWWDSELEPCTKVRAWKKRVGGEWTGHQLNNKKTLNGIITKKSIKLN